MSRWDDLFADPPPGPPTGAGAGGHLALVTDTTGTQGGQATAYAVAALRSEAEQLATMPEGQRNDALNRAAFRMGRHVGAGNIDAATVSHALADAARACGLPQHEIDLVLRDRDDAALVQGTAVPRHPEPRPDLEAPAVTLLDDRLDDAPASRTGEDGHQDDEDDQEPAVASWAPQDLDDVLDGTYTPELPTLMPRADGHHLLYPGRVHSFHGESESGKSLVAQAEAARVLADGGTVLFIDFESDRASVAGRMLELGATPAQLRAGFTYVRPDVDPRRFAHERDAVAHLLARSYTLAVIDGVTEALGIFGASTKDNDDLTTWHRLLPRTVATRTGAAVVLIDHVTKDSEGRGRFAIGGQAKMAALDGAAYVVEVAEALGRGRRGVVVLRVAKDRPGGVRAHAGTFRATDRTQEAARVIVDSTGHHDRIDVTVMGPREGDEVEFRPTHLMEKISLFVEAAGSDGVSGKVLEDGVDGRADTIRKALALLVRDHFVKQEIGPRNARINTSIQPYRQAADTASVHHVTTLETPPRPTSSHLVPDEVRTTSSQPLRSRAGRDEVEVGRTGSPRPDEVDDHELVACKQCFRPIENRLARVTGGRCVKCRTTNGEAGPTIEEEPRA